MAERRVPRIRFKGFEEDWEQRKLGELADIVGGGTPSTSNLQYWDGDIDWYAPAEINEQVYVSSSQKKITKAGYENSSVKLLPVGTVLFTSRAGIGKTAILAREACTNQGFQSIVPHKQELDSYFIFSRSAELKQYGEIVGAGSTFVEVSGKQMSEMELMMPLALNEQQAIGTYFRRLDQRLSLHQRKLEKLKILKKAMLEKMFPKNGAKVPEIRFSGFTDDWEQRKFADMFDCSISNNTFSRAQLSYDEGMVFNIHYGDILTKYGAILDLQTATMPYIVEGEMEEFKNSLLQEGDIVIADTAEDETAGKACEISNLQGAAIVAGLHTVVGRPKIKMAIGYLGYYLNSDVYHNQLVALMQGIKVLSLSRYNIQNTKISFPIIEEQGYVAEFLFCWDSLLSLHQRKLEKLRQIKKSMLERMFV